MKRKRLFAIILLLAAWPAALTAQKISIGSNIADFINLGTVNVEGAVMLSRHWDIRAQLKYNPFTYNKGKVSQFQHKQLTAGAGTRYWPWHTGAGWFAGISLTWTVYNYGGVTSPLTKEGYLSRLNMYAGYSFLLGRRWNLETGWGISAGIEDCTVYDCQQCGMIVSRSSGPVFMPMNIIIQITHLF